MQNVTVEKQMICGIQMSRVMAHAARVEAAKMNISRSMLIRQLIEEFLKQQVEAQSNGR